jgi:protein-disulfide isomerase
VSNRAKNVVLVCILLVAAGLSAAIIAVSVSGAQDDASPTSVHDASAVEALLDGIPQRGNVLGRSDAPVTIVEHADYQCPYCAQWAVNTLPEIVDEYVRPGKVRLVFNGIAILGPDSTTALQATVAAGEQNKLWNVGELLFHNQGPEGSGWVTDDLLERIGASVSGLDVDAMMDRKAAPEVGDAIAKAQAAAQDAGVVATPSFEIGKTGGSITLVEGAQPTDEFRRILDQLLAS